MAVEPEPALPEGAAILVLGQGGLALAERLRAILPGAEIHGFARRVEGADHLFEDTAAHLGRLFAERVPIVGLCAAGILVRALAPHIQDKTGEGPVVAVAEDGGAAVPLLGGHHGANALARRIAAETGGVAAVTTAGDLRLGLALDEPPAGWCVANRSMAGPVTAALLAGEPVGLADPAGLAGWLRDSGAFFAEAGDLSIRVTDEATGTPTDALVLHPPTLALGVGCERGTDPGELIALARATLAGHGLAEGAVAAVTSIDLKADEVAVHGLAEAIGAPARFFDAARLEAEAPRLANPSALVYRETGCHGVAEGAALAAAGPDGTLIVPKTKSRRATCAVARAAHEIQAAGIGQPRGSLRVVGIGPGQAGWRSPEASRAVAGASDVVGYGLYLDLLGNAIQGKARHESSLGAEEERARKALDLAAGGRTVTLVASGDAGIYALATLVFELLDREDRAEWNRIEVAVCPGISAMQAAAARAGAPLGHDFCAISLSDLLTPMADIERRLEAAAAGDFVTALYNPASRARREPLHRAMAILAHKRPGDTPVIIARDLGRAEEAVEVVPLSAFDPDLVDMLTVLIVGSSQTRAIRRGGREWVYTPRGYARKDAARASGAGRVS